MPEFNAISISFENTPFTSGYISPDGKFYGCEDVSHTAFAKHLFDVGVVKTTQFVEDHDIYLEDHGWIKYSMKRFVFYGYHGHQLWTEHQINTVKRYILVNFPKYITYNQKEYTVNEFINLIEGNV